MILTEEHYKLIVLSYNKATGEVVTRASGEMSDKIARPCEMGMLGCADPECRLLALHMYDAHLKIVPIDAAKGSLKEAFNLRLDELLVLDMRLLAGCASPTLAVLYEEARSARHVKTYTIGIREKELRDGPWAQSNLDPGSGILAAVPAPLGGVLVVGEQTVCYLGPGGPRAAPMRCSVTRCVGRIDADGRRWLLSDHLGVLSLLVLVVGPGSAGVVDLKVEVLGETVAASTLTYLDNGVVFVGSSAGDSQLVRLRGPGEAAAGSGYVDILESYVSLAPIVDLCVVDLERQGQEQVVTCSGIGKDGSLRVVRNGVGINEQAAVELPGIKGLWALRGGGGGAGGGGEATAMAVDGPSPSLPSLPSSASAHDKYLVVTFVGETRVLAISDEDELDETSLDGFDALALTLLAANVAHGQLLQVTAAGARLVAGDGGGGVGSFTGGAGGTGGNGQVIIFYIE